MIFQAKEESYDDFEIEKPHNEELHAFINDRQVGDCGYEKIYQYASLSVVVVVFFLTDYSFENRENINSYIQDLASCMSCII